jgi:hypothetical protein
LNSQQLKLGSITTSESQSPLKLVPEVRGLTHIDFSSSRAGDIAEKYATLSLWLRGAEVFPNAGCDGKVDLCFKYSGLIYEVDVKLACYAQSKPGHYSWRTDKASRVRPPVYPLIVVPSTGANLSGWHCRWLQKKGQRKANIKSYHCPPGLENFWDE